MAKPSVDDLIEYAWDDLEEGRLDDAMSQARKAIEIDRHAFDAHIILARALVTDTIAIAVLREAVLAGSRFHEGPLGTSNGLFWLEIRTRPWMRAMHELAVTLWRRGLSQDRHDAIDVARKLIRLNPEDNQGIRFLLWAWMPSEGEWDGMRTLLRRYAGEWRCETAFTAALDAIRRHDGKAANLLADAITTNQYVAPLLLGETAPPDHDGDTVAWMSEEEAMSYAHRAHTHWRSVEGAIDMLRRIHDAGMADTPPSSPYGDDQNSPKMRSTTRDALKALHRGLIGLEFPTCKMIPRPAGESRIMMRGGIFRTDDGRLALVDFDDAVRDPDEPASRRTGYTDACAEDLVDLDLAMLVDVEDTPYQALLMTANGLDIATRMFGATETTCHLAMQEGDEIVISRHRCGA